MKFKIVSRTINYQGFFALHTVEFQYERFCGEISPTVKREIFERGNSVAVLPYDPKTDQVVLIEQFRVAAIKNPQGPWLLELPAGILEEGESPEDVARREAKEETDCLLGPLTLIARYFTSPGGTSEQTWIYAATVDTSSLVPGIHGLVEESEDIRVHLFKSRTAFKLLEAGTLASSAVIIALQWLRRNKKGIRDK
ncbi:MAG: NUDIX domain-containing protein [Gammaproteobacteria bacterium]|nr:NUDIX domain-containing protein [Gammaproteobacteria bacterium]